MQACRNLPKVDSTSLQNCRDRVSVGYFHVHFEEYHHRKTSWKGKMQSSILELVVFKSKLKHKSRIKLPQWSTAFAFLAKVVLKVEEEQRKGETCNSLDISRKLILCRRTAMLSDKLCFLLLWQLSYSKSQVSGRCSTFWQLYFYCKRCTCCHWTVSAAMELCFSIEDFRWAGVFSNRSSFPSVLLGWSWNKTEFCCLTVTILPNKTKKRKNLSVFHLYVQVLVLPFR